MEIKVLGTGCAGCKKTFSNTENAIKDLGLDVTLTKEEDIIKIMKYNVLKLPALVVDEKVVSFGKILDQKEIEKILSEVIK